MTDFATLRGMNPRSFMDAARHLNTAATGQSNGGDDYDSLVATPVSAGGIWSGGGQPDASAVVQVMNLSLDTSSALMSAAGLATVALAIEVAAARTALNSLLAEPPLPHVAVDAGGHADFTPEGKALQQTANHAGASPSTGALNNLLYNQLEVYQGMIDLAVQRATDADTACSRALWRVAWSTVPMETTARPGSLGAAHAANDEAYALYAEAGALPQQLADDAAAKLQRFQDAHEDILTGVFKGFWEGLVGTWQGLTSLGDVFKDGWSSAVAPSRRGSEILANLSQHGLLDTLGQLVDIDDLENGRYGEFVGQNLWWFVPFGKLGDLAKAGGKGLADLAKAGRDAAYSDRVPVPPLRTAPTRGTELPTIPIQHDMAVRDGMLHVHHFTPEELAESRVFVHDGKLYDSHGRPFDTSSGVTPRTGGHGRAIFVMDKNGNLYATNMAKDGYIHHSTFFSGGDVASAGEIEVHDGKLTYMSPDSGHYRPGLGRMQVAGGELKRQGIDFSDVYISTKDYG